MPKAMIATLALLPALALAGECPWLDEGVAAQVLLARPAPAKVEKHPIFANSRGLAASTTCLFRDPADAPGQLTVGVTEFVSYEAATADYRKALLDQGARATASKIGANPAFFTQDAGVSAASCAVKGKRVVRVSHAFGKRVVEARRADAKDAPPSAHEVARRVLDGL